MTDVREVLRRWQAGQSARKIARDDVADRKTASRYIDAARACGVEPTTELTDDLVAEVAQRVQARPLAAPSDVRKVLETERPRIEKWLRGDPPLRLVRVQELLARDGVEVPYTTLRRFVHEELGWREPVVTVRVDDPPPGEEAQVDFGEMGFVTDDEGVRRKLWALIVVLSMSRYMFVWPTFTQTVAAFIGGLEAAWRFFNGVTKRLVPDNLTAAVIHAHPTEPTLNRAFLEYAQWRGFFVDPARVRRPQDKPRVENQVPYARERWFAGEKFRADIDELRADAARWSRDIAGKRVHGTTRCVPCEVYDREERPHMLALKDGVFDVPTWTKPKVHPDHHVQVAKSLYSLPTRYIGKRVDARADQSSVRLYLAGELLKVHRRVEPGKRSTDPNDYPTGKADYALRSIDKLRARAREHGQHVGDFADRLLGGPQAWAQMRQGYALLRLCEVYGVASVQQLCARALAFDVINVPRIERMLKNAQKVETDASTAGKVIRLPASRFARDASAFATIRRDSGNEGGGS